MTRVLASLCSLSLAGCAAQTGSDEAPAAPTADTDPRTAQGDSTDTEPTEPEPTPLAVDMCDEPALAGVTWQTHTTPHFTLSYLPGTAAESDKLAIANRLESAYAEIRANLGVTTEPTFIVNLSPNRVAATQHNKGMGRAWANLNRYDVVYTGMADSFEMNHYGNLLTQVLDFHIDSANRYRIPVLSTGVMEYLDHSARNLHDAYAGQLLAGIESRVRIAELDANDVHGRNRGRAGSLVQFLVDRYGMEDFMTLYKATAAAWNGSCYSHFTYGCISTPDEVTAMLDGLLFAQHGEHWQDIQPLWQAEIEGAIARMPHGMSPTAEDEIANVFRVMDRAIANDDASMYRSAVEGFYCEWGGDAIRQQVSARAVTSLSDVSTQILALYDTGVKNFPTAQAFVMRTDRNGLPTFGTFNFEHLPVGWRMTWGPDWAQ